MKHRIIGNLKSKTSWAGALLVIAGGVQQSGLLELIPEDYQGSVISIVGALVLILRNLTKESVTDKAAPREAGFATPLLLLLLLLAALCVGVLGISGCASNPNTERRISPIGRLALQEAANISMRRYLAETPRAAQRAENIRTIAARLQASTSFTSVTELRATVDREVSKLALSPLDLADARSFLNILEVALRDQIENDLIDSDATVRVNDFLLTVLAVIPPIPPQP